MKLKREFFTRDVLLVAPELVGKALVTRDKKHGTGKKTIITEVEAYRGEEDKASHARFGWTERNRVMYERGGLVYIYLVYGVHWMLNVVTGKVNQPQAVLIRGVADISGPGKVTRFLDLDKSFYGEDLVTSNRLWLIDDGIQVKTKQTPRIGIEYAGEWAKKPWRWISQGILRF